MSDNLYESDDFAMWVENESSVQMKAVTQQGDPVEFSFDEIENIIAILTKWVQRYK
ncbi:hypothetical protein Q4S45_22720 [Massilia sp. R2A-15]|uniref:hypothetical protein n=1 Tax=Massilia sp. R2A-15 TaxID=3064278 RepID=UPI00273310E1|nr:hypothetical protein [Massilia sp. R2A-15]WLI89472.1 hypothetical protein Q4S45_22720 [Massilia sp. R2A-15]